MRARAAAWLAAGVLALSLVGCGGGAPAARDADWDDRWPALSRAGRRWQPGAEFTVVTRKGTAAGPETKRERWTLLKRDSAGGDFEITRAGHAPIVHGERFHPAVPSVPMYGSSGRNAIYPCVGGLVPVTVPAGRFRCGHTWRSFTLSDGAVMREDAWWAPGIPVPVQRWVRWEGVADTLAAPPKRAADVRYGTEWAVLERVRRPQ